MGGIDAIISQCSSEINRNLTLLNSTADSAEGAILNQLLPSLCPSDCNDQGDCVNGTCVCYENFAGNDCDDNKHNAVTLYDLPADGMCDHFYRPCQKFTVYGDRFIESDNLTCQLQVYDMDKITSFDVTMRAATFEHFRKVFCPIVTSILPYYLTMAVSNDNNTFSNSETLLVYDSTCWNCNHSDGCTKKDMSCIIENICYGGDEPNPQNAGEICRPQISEYKWTAGSK